MDFERIKRHIRFNRINVIKTLFVNFRYLNFKDACKLPIWIEGKCKIINHRGGKILIDGFVKPGMIKIGNSDPVRSYFSHSFLEIEGTLKLGSGVILRKGLSLSILPDAVFQIDKNAFIGDNSTVICFERIHIMSNAVIGNNVSVMDTDFHYVVNIADRSVKRNTRPITIGENCWIGGWCMIKKGAKIPKGTIVAGPYSMIGKDYTHEIAEFSMIAGCPAKLVVGGVREVKNLSTESMLRQFFKQERNGVYKIGAIENLDDFCIG